jgi:hypothetical protein
MRVATAHEVVYIISIFSEDIFSSRISRARGTNNKINQKYGYIEGL